jgi:hypothetical protein
MEAKIGTCNEDDNGRRVKGEAAVEEPEKGIKREEANHSDRKVSRFDQCQFIKTPININLIQINVHR